MYKLSPRTRSVLYSIGWSEDRTIDTTPYLKVWKDMGIPVYPHVLEFLSSFGELKGHSPAFIGYDQFEFNAVEAAEETSEFMDEVAGDKLVPIGYCFGLTETILVGSKGACYGNSYGTELVVLGTIEEMLEKLVSPYIVINGE